MPWAMGMRREHAPLPEMVVVRFFVWSNTLNRIEDFPVKDVFSVRIASLACGSAMRVG